MPGFDGMGPVGLGSITGKGRGYCILPVKRTISEKDERKDYLSTCTRLGLGVRRGIGSKRKFVL
ncbi:MAG: DUF5320 domain-containing protein [Bacillota bacterium]|nr:DUF5320 domain-containing protein [Bacillota bacterium]